MKDKARQVAKALLEESGLVELAGLSFAEMRLVLLSLERAFLQGQIAGMEALRAELQGSGKQRAKRARLFGER